MSLFYQYQFDLSWTCCTACCKPILHTRPTSLQQVRLVEFVTNQAVAETRWRCRREDIESVLDLHHKFLLDFHSHHHHHDQRSSHVPSLDLLFRSCCWLTAHQSHCHADRFPPEETTVPRRADEAVTITVSKDSRQETKTIRWSRPTSSVSKTSQCSSTVDSRRWDKKKR